MRRLDVCEVPAAIRRAPGARGTAPPSFPPQGGPAATTAREPTGRRSLSSSPPLSCPRCAWLLFLIAPLLTPLLPLFVPPHPAEGLCGSLGWMQQLEGGSCCSCCSWEPGALTPSPCCPYGTARRWSSQRPSLILCGSLWSFGGRGTRRGAEPAGVMDAGPGAAAAAAAMCVCWGGGGGGLSLTGQSIG